MRIRQGEITHKQEQFCRNIVEGMTHKEAYKAAYACNSDQAANIEAMKLMQKQFIRDRIEELRKPVELAWSSEVNSARLEQIERINERIEECKKNGDESNLRQYMDQLNKIYGLYKEDPQAEKKQNNELGNLDTNALKSILELKAE